MKKAIMIATHPKWVKQIIDGTKTLEFRNYAIPVGMKVYVYMTKKYKRSCLTPQFFADYHNENVDRNPLDDTYATADEFKFVAWNSGLVDHRCGKVVLEFVVGERYEVLQLSIHNNYFYDESREVIGTCTDFVNMGYDDQKYAHTITDLIVYDEEWIGDELNKFDDFPNGVPVQKDYSWYDKVKTAPTKPLDITEFVGWNKYKKSIKKWGLSNVDWDENKLTTPPQGRVYVVEREINK